MKKNINNDQPNTEYQLTICPTYPTRLGTPRHIGNAQAQDSSD